MATAGPGVKAWALSSPGLKTHSHPSQAGPPLVSPIARGRDLSMRLQGFGREGLNSPAHWCLSQVGDNTRPGSPDSAPEGKGEPSVAKQGLVSPGLAGMRRYPHGGTGLGGEEEAGRR